MIPNIRVSFEWRLKQLYITGYRQAKAEQAAAVSKKIKMKTNTDKTNNGLNRLVYQLTANKKKSVIAAILLVLMIFMWVRMLGKGGPRSAMAVMGPQAGGADASSPAKNLNVVFVELPYIEGRHDVLVRDFFRMDGQFFGAAEEVSIISADKGKNEAREVAQGLRLDAISTGQRPEAFINDRLVKVGDTIVVEGSKLYECEVKSIEENSVIVKYGETEIELKLKQPDEAAKRFED
jgi:hypothetical protein